MKVVFDLKTPDFGDNLIPKLGHNVIISKNEIKSAFLNSTDGVFQAFKCIRFLEEIKPQNFNEFIISNFEFNVKPYSRKIAFSHQRFCLIPNFINNDQIIEKAYELCFKKQDGEILKKESFNELNSQMIFGLNANHSNFLKEIDNQQFTHFASCFLKNILSRKFYSDSNEVFIEIEQHFLLIIIIKNGKFQLINTYIYKNNEDILYHLLNLSTIFDLNPDKDTYFISGDYSKGSKLDILLHDYIRYLFLFKIDSKLAPFFSNELDLAQQFYPLMIM